MQLNPARGRKPLHNINKLECIRHRGLCSSTPRGDGNPKVGELVSVELVRQVYAAQPREGTETLPFSLCHHS